MLQILDLYKQVSSKPAQPHQKCSIIGGKLAKYFGFGIAAQYLDNQGATHGAFSKSTN
jgi:hypothetical protein